MTAQNIDDDEMLSCVSGKHHKVKGDENENSNVLSRFVVEFRPSGC